jgi:Uma2 family endonuclease
MATVTSPPSTINAEEFARRPDPGYPEELVEGRVVTMSPPGARHGQICAEAVWVFRGFAKEHDLGHVLSNDSGVVTRREPDSVRGADLAFYSFARLPRGPLPATYPGVVPDLVVEVRSPNDRWSAVLFKVAEYLGAGVNVVCVLDDSSRSVQVFDAEHPVRTLGEGDELTLPGVLPGFRVPVRRFFD